MKISLAVWGTTRQTSYFSLLTAKWYYLRGFRKVESNTILNFA